MGPLSGIIEPGVNGVWLVSQTETGVRLTNQEGDGDITYYYVDSAPGDAGNRTVTTTVSLQNASPDALAGILYGYQENPKSYYLFTLGSDGAVNLHYRGVDGFEQKMQSSLENAPLGPVTLTIIENGREITLMANGNRIGGLGNDGLGQGDVGIVAANPGTFDFSEFSISVGASVSLNDLNLPSE